MKAGKKSRGKHRIAITGGRGRMAPGLAAHLRGAGYEVALFSRLADQKFGEVALLTRPEELSVFDTVLHLGWSSVPLVSEENPGIEEQQDFPFVRALVDAAAQCTAKPRLVFFSTAAVYGDTGSDAVTESESCRPLGRYAAAKLEAEKLFARHDHACVLRVTNVFGSGCPLTRPQGIIPVLLAAARSGNVVPIWGDGSTVKDYLAAPDLHRAVESAIASDLRGTFNVSSGCSLSVNELIALVENTCGHSVRCEHLPHYSWDVTMSHVSSEKLRLATGWKPELLPRDFVQALLR